MFQKICIGLDKNKNRFRFFLISSNKPTIENLNMLYKEAKFDFKDLDEHDVQIGISKEGVYKDFLYIFFDIAMPEKFTLEKYFKVKNFY